MEFYRTAGGPGYFKLDPEFIVPMLLKRKQLCDEDITDPSEKVSLTFILFGVVLVLL